MSIVVTLLWFLGIAFLVILWMSFAASIIEIGYGILGRRGLAARSEGAREGFSELWRRGLVAGAIGYAVVVVIYAGLNAIAGRSVFLTPSLLGESLLGKPVGGAIEAAPVLIYNGLHLVVFLGLGMAAAWLLLESGRHPKIWYLAFVLLLALFLHAIGFVLWLSAPAGSVIPGWSVVIAGAVAGVAMATYLLFSAPRTMAVLRAADLEA